MIQQNHIQQNNPLSNPPLMTKGSLGQIIYPSQPLSNNQMRTSIMIN